MKYNSGFSLQENRSYNLPNLKQKIIDDFRKGEQFLLDLEISLSRALQKMNRNQESALPQYSLQFGRGNEV